MNLLPPMFDTFTPHDLTHYPPFQYIETPKMKSESDWNEKWSNQNDTHKQLMNQFFTHLRSWTSEYTILNMGLPVEEIMAEVEEELMNMNEEELDHMDRIPVGQRWRWRWRWRWKLSHWKMLRKWNDVVPTYIEATKNSLGNISN